MSTRDELEASLRARYDQDTLAVYADFLQSHNDPRGELIALDLRESTPAVEKRRSTLLRRWLGEDFALHYDDTQRIWYVGDLASSYATFDCGFVDLYITSSDDSADIGVAHLLAAPAGEYIRRLTLRGPTDMLELLLAIVASRRRPWLQHLAISRPREWMTLLVPPLLERKLVDALPDLEVLDLKGNHLFDRFTHPNLRELGITGCEAIDLVDIAGPPLPSLHTIDFALDGDRPVPRGVFSTARVPALRRLCVAREESNDAMFELLGSIAVAPQLTHLVLQSLRSRREVALVQAAIARMPLLREVSVARAYKCFGHVGSELLHPYARIHLPEPWPWRPRDQFSYQPLLVDGHLVELNDLVDALEEQYVELSDDERAIWSRFWSIVETLGSGAFEYREQAFHAGDLSRALDALVLSSDLSQFAVQLRERVAKRGGYFVTIRR